MVLSRVKALWKVIKSSRKENRIMKQYSECAQLKSFFNVYDCFLYKHESTSSMLMDSNTSDVVKNILQFVDILTDSASSDLPVEEQMDNVGVDFVDKMYRKLPRMVMNYNMCDDEGYDNADMKLEGAVMILKHLFDFIQNVLCGYRSNSKNISIPSIQKLVDNCRDKYKHILVKATYKLNSRFNKTCYVDLTDCGETLSYDYNEVMIDALSCDLSFDKQAKDKEDK